MAEGILLFLRGAGYAIELGRGRDLVLNIFNDTGGIGSELDGSGLAQVEGAEAEVKGSVILAHKNEVNNFVSDASKDARYGFDRLTANIG